jgi:hypothetical protein
MSAIDALRRYFSGQVASSRAWSAEWARIQAEGDRRAARITVFTVAEAGGPLRCLGLVHGAPGPSFAAAVGNLRAAADAMGADVVVGMAMVSVSTAYTAGSQPSFVAYGTAGCWSDESPVPAITDTSEVSVVAG